MDTAQGSRPFWRTPEMTRLRDMDTLPSPAPLRTFAGLRPAPDSIIGCALRHGRPAWSEGIHVLWSVWVFVVPMFSPQGYDLRWLLITLLSYPVFIALYAGALLLPARRSPWCALGMIALCFTLLPWYVSSQPIFRSTRKYGMMIPTGGSIWEARM